MTDLNEPLVMKWATIMARSLEAKLTDFTVNPRLITGAGVDYVEFGIRQKGKSILDEIHVAYAANVVQDMEDETKRMPTAQRIFKEVKLRLGIRDEE